MAKASHRDSILDAGLKVMFRKGYVGAGVRDIVLEAGAPQGSFTNHFRSKEAFAGEVLDRYFDRTKALVAEALGNARQTPRQRLMRYLDIITERLEADEFARGCLIGDFSLEAAFADCIREAQASGEIDDTFASDELADFLLASWEGAILRMKVTRTAEPLQRFKRIAFATVFKEAKK
jgi:TetR/AcrR family transcriptional repressor of nem operon